MVNNMGIWIPEADYSKCPKSQWCDMDYVMNLLNEQNYTPKTQLDYYIEDLIARFVNHEDFNPKYNKDNGFMINVDIQKLLDFENVHHLINKNNK